MGAVTQEYAASSNLTVTNLHSLPASSTLLSGWTSGTIDNTSTKYEDILISAKFTKASSNMQAGSIQVWAYAMLDDSNWPDLFSSGMIDFPVSPKIAHSIFESDYTGLNAGCTNCVIDLGNNKFKNELKFIQSATTLNKLILKENKKAH